jgi:amidase
VKGLKIGILKEGFEFEDMKQDVAEFVKVAARKLTGAGAIVEDTSVPLHTDGTV